jgi:hypothetical protein
MTTPLALINKVNKEMKLPQHKTGAFVSAGSLASAQLEGLNWILADIDNQDPLWAVRQASYMLTTDPLSSVNELGFDLTTLSGDTIKLSRIRQVRHADDHYPIHQTTHEQYEEHLLPSSNYRKSTITSGKPSRWFLYNDTFYLVADVPNSAQNILIYYQASLSTPLTTTDLESPTAIVYPLSDENMLKEGIRWRTRLYLTQDENHVSVLAARNLYELELMKSSVDNNSGKDHISMDPGMAAMFTSCHFIDEGYN